VTKAIDQETRRDRIKVQRARHSAVLGSLARWGRLAIYFVAMLLVCLYCEVVGRVWSLWLTEKGSAARARRANLVTRHWHVVLTELTLTLLDSRLDVRGTVPEGRYIVVSNHQSIADIAVIPWALRTLNVKFVAKDTLGRGIPTVSMALRHWGSALISRQGTRSDIACLKAMAGGLAYWDASVVVFPEGTRSRDGRLQPYKSGAVRVIANETQLSLLPIAIDGTHVAPDIAGFAAHIPKARGVVTIGTPVPYDAWNGRLDEAIQGIRDWAHSTIECGRRDGSVPPPISWIEGAPDLGALSSAVTD
jgi:1-acyl-sn-glycerol-3-phosphate acyltransferase